MNQKANTKSPLDEVVFVVIGNDEIKETTIRDCSIPYLDVTTTPGGVVPRLHLRGNEVWSWGYQGGSPRRISTHDTEAEARLALDGHYADDFWMCPDIVAFRSRPEAESLIGWDDAEDSAV